MKVKPLIILILFGIMSIASYSQQLFYQDVFYGGVTGIGFSTGTQSAIINSSVIIPPNSKIKKAFLIATTDSTPPPITITLNGIGYTFNDETITLDGFKSYQSNSISRTNSSIRIIDITNNIDSSITSYTLHVPSQTDAIQTQSAYTHFYLYITFENNQMNKICCYIFLNNQDVDTTNIYSLKILNALNNSLPIGLELLTSHFCYIDDGSYVYINNNLLGLIYGNNINKFYGCGTYTDFAHFNDTLYGLRDDTPDSIMNASDALADIKNYVNFLDTIINVSFIKNPTGGNNLTNPIRLLMLSYSTPCDTFSTSAYAVQDTICFGDSVQLFASGGVKYRWFGAYGGLSDTAVANPKASPPQTTTYIVTITNDSGCVKTEHVKIHVIPPPNKITATPSVCGSSTGKITIVEFNGDFNFSLLDSNNNSVASNNTGIFNQLPHGTYMLQSQNQQCTYYDTVTIGYVNQTVASFWRNPYKGKAPLTVNFGNQSQMANQYIWLFPNDTFYTPELTYTFDSGGVYPVCLVAYNNYPYCSDTTCYTFVIEDSLQLFVPNVFSPNGDGKNDFFTLKIIDSSQLENISASIFNRWGEEIHRFETATVQSSMLTLWDGTTGSGVPVANGTYFYTLTTVDKQGKKNTRKGSVTLLR